MPDPNRPLARGRGSQIDPPNRFGGTHHEVELELRIWPREELNLQFFGSHRKFRSAGRGSAGSQVAGLRVALVGGVHEQLRFLD